MNNVTTLVKGSCPKVELVETRGIVGDEKVYSGVADKETNWTIVEFGRRNSGGFLGSIERTGEQPEKPDYLNTAGFLTFPGLLTKMADKGSLCTEHRENDNSCSLITTFEDTSDAGAVMITRQLLDEEGAIGTVSLQGAVAADGMWCGAPANATVTAKGGKLVDGSKGQKAMEDMLLERVQDKGKEICVGFADNDGVLTTAQFDQEGFQLTNDLSIAPFATAPNLRRE